MKNIIIMKPFRQKLTMKLLNILPLAFAALMYAGCKQTNEQTSSTESSDDAITELMMSRRSIRNYKDSLISRETLDEILKCGVNAPNGKNLQAYEIRVLSPALIDSITNAVVKDKPELAEREGFKNIFVNAPCVLCIAYDTTYDMSQVDCGLLGENIILSAWSKGIGSCCLGSSARWIKDSPSAKQYLNKMAFSEGYELLYCIALGYPNETPAAKPRTMDKIKYME